MAMFFIRSTATGNEYWDNVDKKTVLVPKGEEPKFEVESDNSMIISVDYANGKDQTVFTEVKQNSDKALTVKEITIPEGMGIVNDEMINQELINEEDLIEEPGLTFEELEKLNIPKLREKAKELGIDVPAAIRTKGDIINLILGVE